TSSDIENQKLFLMLDAVSAHTDCLIQIVKERHAYRVEEAHLTLLTSKVKRLFSLFFRRPLPKEAGSSGWRGPPYWYGRIIGSRAVMTRAFSPKRTVRSDIQQSGSISFASPPFRAVIGFKLNI
ncbi:hypothetical protein, partial [Aeromonas caviae]|uniref:hypothetical protein n=1 Tax=Aeromonas caviae TaxID=648 RepID=UPI0025B6C59D